MVTSQEVHLIKKSHLQRTSFAICSSIPFQMPGKSFTSKYSMLKKKHSLQIQSASQAVARYVVFQRAFWVLSLLEPGQTTLELVCRQSCHDLYVKFFEF